MVMWRKTFESLPGILPGRDHIVLTKSPDYSFDKQSVYIAHDIAKAIELWYNLSASDKVFVIGGAQILQSAIQANLIDEIYMTRIEQKFDVSWLDPVYFWLLDILSRDKETYKDTTKSLQSQPEWLSYHISKYTKTS